MTRVRETPPAPAPDPFKPTTILVERFKLIAGKSYVFLTPVMQGLDGRSWVRLATEAGFLAGKATKGWQAGMVYEIEVVLDPNNSRVYTMRPTTARTHCLWPHEGERSAARATQHAIEVAKRAEKHADKQSEVLRSLEALEPLRKHYKAADFYGRIAIEATLVAYLRK
jgi:hypothetical protein